MEQVAGSCLLQLLAGVMWLAPSETIVDLDGVRQVLGWLMRLSVSWLVSVGRLSGWVIGLLIGWLIGRLFC